MNKLITYAVVFAVWAMFAFGCGGGSGGNSSEGTVVTGVASKGIIRNGIVRVFEVDPDGGKGKLLKETTTDQNGKYQAELGTHTGPVLVEVTGSYTDETTGAIMTIPDAAPLRAAVGSADGAVTVSVTPLTELALRQVEDPVSKKLAVADIDTANARVGALFGVPIVTTMPIDATATVPAGASREQKEYSLALAALSGMMDASREDLSGLVAELNSSISGGSLTLPAATSFQNALKTFISSDRNWTDIRDVSATRLINVGGSVVKLRLNLVGPGTPVAKGVLVAVALPLGVSVKVQQNMVEGVTLASSLSGALLSGSYHPTDMTSGIVTVAIVTTAQVPLGEFATISCDVAPGRTVGVDDFAITEQKVIGENGTIPGLTVTVSLGDRAP